LACRDFAILVWFGIVAKWVWARLKSGARLEKFEFLILLMIILMIGGWFVLELEYG
jgi:hypothetical protein